MVDRLVVLLRTGRWLLLILALALVIRVWNIDYPDWKYTDEQNVIDRALLLGHQGLNPKWFVYPSLFLYFLFILDGCFYALGALSGAFASPEEFASFYFSHPLALHLVGRGLALVCGLACLALTYQLGHEGWGTGVGLAAIALLAVSPIYSFSSRIAKPDVLMALFALLAAWAIVRYLSTEKDRWLWTAGVAVGLAASTKYLAGLSVVWLVAAPWLRIGWPGAVWRTGVALCVAAGAFLIGTPFAILDWPTFIGSFQKVAALMHTTWYGSEDRIGYQYYFLDSLPLGLGWPATLAGLVGLGRWLIVGRAQERLLAGFVAVYYAWMGYPTHVGDFFILPIYPLWVLAGADLMRLAVGWVQAVRPRVVPWCAVGMAVVFLLLPFMATMKETVLLNARDTRELAGQWVQQHIPVGTRILSEPYGPFVPVSEGRLEELIAAEARRNPGHGMRLQFKREKAKQEDGFWYHEMELFNDPILGRPVLEEYELDRFLAQGYRIVVLSSGVYDRYRRLPERYPVQNAFFEQVTRSGTLIARIDPFTPWCCPQSLNARVLETAAVIFGRPGPTLLIYRLKEE
jgi:4-amino-4-deoxy-L-arabinose transferase-like glycosyltransferase